MNETWKYENIYDSANIIKMEGFTSLFPSSKERNIKLDARKLTLEHELGKLTVNVP